VLMNKTPLYIDPFPGPIDMPCMIWIECGITCTVNDVLASFDSGLSNKRYRLTWLGLLQHMQQHPRMRHCRLHTRRAECASTYVLIINK